MTDIPILFFFLNSNASGGPWGYASANEGGHCSHCGTRPHAPIGTMTLRINPRKRWPDAFGINNYTGCVVAERVVSTLIDNGVDVGVGPVEFEFMEEGGIAPPNYYYLVPKPGLALDLAAGGIILENYCPRCGLPRKTTYLQHQGTNKFVPLVDTWTGLDIFKFTNLPHKACCCSLRILELARQHKWSNFSFHSLRINRPTGAEAGPYNIDYKSRTNWPPQELLWGH